jgi:hypothetical protein
MNVGTRLDRIMSWSVRVAYIIGTFFGWFGMFTGTVLNNPVVTYLSGAALAGAVVTHEFLQLRRAELYRRRAQRSTTTPTEGKHFKKLAFTNFTVSCIILAAGSFMLYNHFTVIGGGVDVFGPNSRALIECILIPLFAAISTLLTEIEDDPNGLLARAAYEMTQKAVKLVQQQWDDRVQNVVQSGHNLSPVAIALMVDAGDEAGAKRIRIIEEGLATAEGFDLSKNGMPYISPAQAGRALAAGRVDNPKQTGRKAADGGPKASSEAVQFGQASSTKNGQRKPRAVTKLTASKRAERFVSRNPNATLSEVMSGARVSKTTAILAREAIRQRTGTEG